ncbi:MAG: TIGR01777 family oxidoreductase [Candidatus Hydrogenedentes bacterium]|nr:TIGR01777 family oxidoreductase [Candidatus Hydrogenedentota bacterium]
MRIIIGGGSGLIGHALDDQLRESGHEIQHLVRKAPGGADILWDPNAGRLDVEALSGADILVHLSGEGVASGRWTAAKKQAIRDSRVKSTQLLASALTSISAPPKVWLCASAIGWYGSRGDEWLDEDSSPGTGFLADVCKEWEDSTLPARDAGIRVVNLRFGIVLAADGGAFKQMMTAFKFGVGGVIGDGKQYISWIDIRDVVQAILHALDNPFIAGPLNVCSPSPVTNHELTKTLGHVLKRPTFLSMPAGVARFALGEMADEMLLASTRVTPKRLEESGFTFAARELEPALRNAIYSK